MDKGLKILLNTYWCSKGWKKRQITPEDYTTAKEEGYMFDYPDVIDHKKHLKYIKETVELISPMDVANAFLYSLSTRRLDYRSALGSYWYAVSIPHHICTKNLCLFCRWSPWEKEPEMNTQIYGGVNILNFERYKWGGVRHTDANYALFDLQEFLKLPKVIPTEHDWEILHNILACISELEPKNKAAKLQKLITKKKILKSNAQEINTLLDILGICGILASKEHPCYADKFVDIYHRNPPELTNDRTYPLNHWKVWDGINVERYKTVFGEEYKAM